MSIVSFDLEGDFAAFRDPSVTTNQTVTVIPPKSALIGLIGAILGVKRSNSIFDNMYGTGYLDLLAKTAVGIKVRSQVNKCTFFTNHRSLKEAKTKPFKTELLINPQYTVYVKSTEEVNQTLLHRLKTNRFEFTPSLGQAYCLARISKCQEILVKPIEPNEIQLSTVFLDENIESKSQNQGVAFDQVDDLPVKVLVERHLHHYIIDDSLKRSVLRHYIPVPENGKNSVVQISAYESPLALARFYAVEGSEEALCLY